MQTTSAVLADLGPGEQLRAGRLGRRVAQLLAGLVLYGVSMGLMIRGGLGLDPWDVLHSGLASHLPLSFGAVVTLVGVVVLLAWVPLRQAPGLGTVLNVLVIGAVTDLTLRLVPHPRALAVQVALTVLGGVVLNGLAGATYIGAQLGPGPRDGLMTGLSRRTGLSIRLVRTVQEVTVVAVGFLLGGSVGLGTVLYAVGIGPVVQLLLPHVVVRLDAAGLPRGAAGLPGGAAGLTGGAAGLPGGAAGPAGGAAGPPGGAPAPAGDAAAVSAGLSCPAS